MWMGRLSAAATSSQSGVTTEQDMSRAKPMTEDRAVSRTVFVISRTIASIRLAMTASSMGSSGAPGAVGRSSVTVTSGLLSRAGSCWPE